MEHEEHISKTDNIVNYQILAEKMYELVKGENLDDVELAAHSLLSGLKRMSIVN